MRARPARRHGRGGGTGQRPRKDPLAVREGARYREERDAQVTFCLEYDRSTETLERLEKKLKSYEDLQIASGSAYWILFCLAIPAGKPVPGGRWQKPPSGGD